MSRDLAHDLWRRFVNPDLVNLLETFDFGRCFTRAEGTCLCDDQGRRYTDLLAGFGVHNIGHNHPVLRAALQDHLRSLQPSILNIDAPLLAGQLAEQLTRLTHESLCRTAFGNSGAEAVDLAIRAARTATGRADIIACDGAYHGLSGDSLCLIGDADIRKQFHCQRDTVHHIPYDDLSALEDMCRRYRSAAFIVEPIQAEGGIRCPAPTFLASASEICHRHGVLLIVDEIQTGLGRTGHLFATDIAQVRPDILLIGKALSGGIVPASAAMMTTHVWKRAFSGPRRCTFASSTFAGNSLAMAAGLAVLSVIEKEDLAARSEKLGCLLIQHLSRLQSCHGLIRQVRGSGLLIGVEFAEATGILPKMVPAWARQGLYAQVMSLLLLRDHCLLTQPCSLEPRVLRIEPPLTIEEADMLCLVTALDEALRAYPSHNAAVIAAFRKVILKGGI